jgi:O-antigen ligase
MFGPKVKYTPTGVGIMCTAPHNSWVQAGAETGFVGLSLYAAMTVGGMIGMFRLRNRLPRRWQRADDDRRFVYIGTTMVGFASIGYLVTSSFLSFAWMDMPYLLAALQGGLYFASRPLLAEDESVAGAVEGDDA